MIYFEFLMLGFLIACAIGTVCTRNLLSSITVFMAFSAVMSVIWLVLESPDLAITEAAVGAGVDGVLFFLTLRKLHLIDKDFADDEEGQVDEGVNVNEE